MRAFSSTSGFLAFRFFRVRLPYRGGQRVGNLWFYIFLHKKKVIKVRNP